MKTFITINGDSAYITECESILEAKTKAENTCNNSKEVIVREINHISDFRQNQKKELERRFKVVALLIMCNEELEFLDEKVALTADAIDMGYPKAIELVQALEDFTINVCGSVEVGCNC